VNDQDEDGLKCFFEKKFGTMFKIEDQETLERKQFF